MAPVARYSSEGGAMMAWDFIKMFNAFTDLSIGNLDVNAIVIYLRLFAANNRIGRLEWFTMTNQRLVAETGLREPTVIDARNRLIQKGFIQYIKGKKGSPSKYKLNLLYDEKFMNDLNCFTKNNLVNNFKGIPSTSNSENRVYAAVNDEYIPSTYLVKNAKNVNNNAAENPLQSKGKQRKVKENDSSVENGDTDDLTNSEDFAKVVAVFEQCVHPIKNELEKDSLMDLINTYGADKVIVVIHHADETQRAKGDRVQSVKYLETILKRWKNSGFKELGGSKNNGRYGRENDGSMGRKSQRGINRGHNEEVGTRNAIFANQSEPWDDE